MKLLENVCVQRSGVGGADGKLGPVFWDSGESDMRLI